MSQTDKHIPSADEIYQQVTDGWPSTRTSFQATADEIVSLARGGLVTKVDLDNGDGTYTTEVTFREKTFICVSAAKVAGRIARV